MTRDRSRPRESQSVNRRQLRDGIVDSDVLKSLAVHERHLRPGIVGKTIIKPRTINETHLDREIVRQLGNSTVEHVTLTAEASQSIASGGATVQWATEADAPIERRGFDTLNSELGDGSVGDIPIDITGTLNFILFGEWASYRGCDTVTVTLVRAGETSPSATFDLGPVHSRFFDGGDDGWEVKAGDHLRIELSNDSGEVQTLTSATFVGKIIGVPTTAIEAAEPPQTDLFIWWKADTQPIGAITSWPNEIEGVGWDLTDDGGVRTGGTVVDDVLNGLPVVRLDGDLDGFYATGDAFPADEDFTIYVVWRLRDFDRDEWVMRGAQTDWAFRYVSAIDGWRWWNMDEANAAGVFSWRYDSVVDSTTASSTTWRRDGSIIATSSGHGRPSFLSLGYARTVSTTRLGSNIDFAEMLVYTAVHTDSERAEVIDYLTNRWGL